MKKCEIFKNFYGRFPVWQHVTITHISNPDATLSMKTTIHPCSNLQTDLEHPLVKGRNSKAVIYSTSKIIVP